MNTNPCTLTTGEVRFSYLHVFQPYAQQQGAEPKYSATLLIPKTDVATKGLIDAAINAATNNGVGSKWNGIRPPQLRISVHDGDGGRPSDGMPFGDECKGHWVVTASNKNAPFVVDANVQPILQQNEVYSGMYGRASITFFPYASNGNKGVGCAPVSYTHLDVYKRQLQYIGQVVLYRTIDVPSLVIGYLSFLQFLYSSTE